MCTNCLNYQFLARSNLSTSANPAPAPDVQAPAFVVETVENPSAEPASQNGLVAGANYVEIADAPNDVSTPYELVIGDTFSGVTDRSSDFDWIRITVEANTIIEINSAITPGSGTGVLGFLYDENGTYIKSKDKYDTNSATLIHYNNSDESSVFYFGTNAVDTRYPSNYPIEYTISVEEVPEDRYRFEEGADAPNDASTPYELVAGETFSGAIDGIDWDWIRVISKAGQTLEITVEGNIEAFYTQLFGVPGGHGNYERENVSDQKIILTYKNVSDRDLELYVEVSDVASRDPLDYTVSVQDVTPPPPPPLTEFTYDEIADYLTTGYWGGRFAFDVAPGGTLTVDTTGLTADGRYLAEHALDAWTAVTGINFRSVSSGAQITFDDNDAGASAEFFNTGARITSADINISTAWLNTYGTSLSSYSFQTYIHEIGHALGLGHAGNYNGNATFGADNHYLNDSWQASVMSYFDQEENTHVDASFAYILSPMIADILAIQELYGVPANVHNGNTTYGFNSTAGGYLDDFVNQTRPVAGTIVDSSGTDTLDFSGFSAAQKIDLRQEMASDIGGLTGNFFIARGSVIENAVGGRGNDILTGNDAANNLKGGAGDDILNGRDGNDTLDGGAGRDTVSGGAGNDNIIYETGDRFWDNQGRARDVGGTGIDTLTVLTSSSFSTSNLSWYGFERFDGGGGSDRVGGRDANVNYYLNGRGGDDTLTGGSGNDTLIGGAGRDHLTGGAGNDTISYGAGDYFWDDQNRARDVGGAGFDTLTIEAGTTFSTSGLSWYGFEGFVGADGNDRVFGNLASVDYRLEGGAGNDTLKGNAGDDTLIGGAGRDHLTGGAGNDTISYGAGDYFWDDQNRARDVGGAGFDTLTIEAGTTFSTSGLSWYGFEGFVGADGNDRVFGNLASVDYRLEGGAGNDTLRGNAGDDTLIGGAGRDHLTGGAGNDTISFGTGDYFWDAQGRARDVGGTGTDTLTVEDGSTFSTSGLSWYGFERFVGGAGNDRVSGNLASVDYRLEGGAGDDILAGAGGDDTLIGGAGSDRYSGGAGNDTIYYGAGDSLWDGNGRALDIGGSGIDTLIGSFSTSGLSWYGIERFIGAGANDRVSGNSNAVDYYINGGQGNDVLAGAGGDDTLLGGAGTNTLTGGGGADTFHFNTTGFTDTITDFQDTVDMIEIDTGADSFAALTILDDGGDAHITYAGSTIILDNFNFALLSADDFNFV